MSFMGPMSPLKFCGHAHFSAKSVHGFVFKFAFLPEMTLWSDFFVCVFSPIVSFVFISGLKSFWKHHEINKQPKTGQCFWKTLIHGVGDQ